jgi:DNA-binding LacI/PurR family transcriptional regulator
MTQTDWTVLSLHLAAMLATAIVLGSLARRLGIPVPSALSVVGIDNHEFAEMFSLTTLEQSPRSQGMQATRMLLGQLEDPARVAQDVSIHTSGAYTGEVSAAMVADFGASFVIVGHSERRAHHSETSALVAGKAAAALAAGLTPIICLGETLEERETDMTEVLGDAVKTAVLPNIPVRRFGKPEEIAAAVAYATSDEAGFLTAQTIVVDGGMAS